MSPGGVHYFAGPWHEWRLEKAARAAAAERTADRVSEDIARLERFVARFRYKKSKAKQAQAKLTQIDRLEKERATAREELESLTRRRRSLGFDFLNPPRTGRIVLEADHISLSAGDKQLLANATIVVERGEKVALVGPNGSGKTTLLEAILGGAAFDAGTATLGHGVVPGYFSQHTQELPRHGSVLDATAAATGLPRPQAQTLLGRFLFSGWETHERAVTALSGGERRRLSLALLVASGANFLVLDEPTNHLDLESREALEAALEAFPGTVLIVSHDRALLDAVPDRIVAIEGGTLRSYDGGWADLTRERAAPEPDEQPTKERKPRPARERAERTSPTELELVEASIAATEARISELEGKLAGDWSDMDVLTTHRAARDELQSLLARWEALFDDSQRSPL
jgi:ATP-binding cassette subfamily F protein 3